MGPDGRYTRGEHHVMYREVESLCCTLESNVTLSVVLKLKKTKIKNNDVFLFPLNSSESSRIFQICQGGLFRSLLVLWPVLLPPLKEISTVFHRGWLRHKGFDLQGSNAQGHSLVLFVSGCVGTKGLMDVPCYVLHPDLKLMLDYCWSMQFSLN